MRLFREVESFLARGYLVALAVGALAAVGLLAYAQLVRIGLVLR